MLVVLVDVVVVDVLVVLVDVVVVDVVVVDVVVVDVVVVDVLVVLVDVVVVDVLVVLVDVVVVDVVVIVVLVRVVVVLVVVSDVVDVVVVGHTCTVVTSIPEFTIPGCVSVVVRLPRQLLAPLVKAQHGSPSSYPLVIPSPSESAAQSAGVHCFPAAAKARPKGFRDPPPLAVFV